MPTTSEEWADLIDCLNQADGAMEVQPGVGYVGYEYAQDHLGVNR